MSTLESLSGQRPDAYLILIVGIVAITAALRIAYYTLHGITLRFWLRLSSANACSLSGVEGN